jgi:hypothetical protein
MKSILIISAALAITVTTHAQFGGLGKKIPGIGGGTGSSSESNVDLGKLESDSFDKVTPAAEKLYEASVLLNKALGLKIEEIKEEVANKSKKEVTIARISASQQNFKAFGKAKESNIKMSPEQQQLFSQGRTKLDEGFAMLVGVGVPIGFQINEAIEPIKSNPTLALQYSGLMKLGLYCIKDVSQIAELNFKAWQIGKEAKVPGIPDSGPAKSFTPKKG